MTQPALYSIVGLTESTSDHPVKCQWNHGCASSEIGSISGVGSYSTIISTASTGDNWAAALTGLVPFFLSGTLELGSTTV